MIKTRSPSRSRLERLQRRLALPLLIWLVATPVAGSADLEGPAISAMTVLVELEPEQNGTNSSVLDKDGGAHSSVHSGVHDAVVTVEVWLSEESASTVIGDLHEPGGWRWLELDGLSLQALPLVEPGQPDATARRTLRYRVVGAVRRESATNLDSYELTVPLPVAGRLLDTSGGREPFDATLILPGKLDVVDAFPTGLMLPGARKVEGGEIEAQPGAATPGTPTTTLSVTLPAPPSLLRVVLATPGSGTRILGVRTSGLLAVDVALVIALLLFAVWGVAFLRRQRA